MQDNFSIDLAERFAQAFNNFLMIHRNSKSMSCYSCSQIRLYYIRLQKYTLSFLCTGLYFIGGHL